MIRERLYAYRFELLLATLLLVLFDKAFVSDNVLYTRLIWPLNMVMLGLASAGIFGRQQGWHRWLLRGLLAGTILIPLIISMVTVSPFWTELSFAVYMLYYLVIFIELLQQIFRRSEPNLSVLFGSVSGFLLLVFMAQFVFLHIEFAAPGSFAGLHDRSIPGLYRQLSYFSMVTLATVGYGDITPVSDAARLLTMFFAICGQFYLVALVGILVSRYSAVIPNNQTSI